MKKFEKKSAGPLERLRLRSGIYASAVTVLVVVLAVLLNLIVRAIPTKYTEFDLSEAGLYTLSDSSKDIAHALTQDVTIYYLAETGSEDAIITKLLDTGYAYQAGGNVYFDTSKLEKYFVFNDFSEEDLAVGVREGVEEDPNKRNRNDFVLWFTKSKFEDQALKWDSPWGVGYPGWHIECSGISMKYNGEYLDLHCGGVDNAFPHHTNEIAQSESYLGHPWCPQWFHVAHLNTDHGKMSKSKGEFLTVSLLEQKGYDPLAYRFFCLQSHYRKGLLFSWENLDNAALAYNKLLAKVAALKPGQDEVEPAALEELKAKFRKAMDSDLNTSMGVTVLYDVLKAKTTDATKLAALDALDSVLGLKLLEKAETLRAKQAAAPAAGGFTVVSESGEEDADVEAKIRARAEAKKAKNFAEADRIRDELKSQGIEITDIPGGVKWKHI